MSWVTGSIICNRIIEILFEKIDDPELREEIYTELIQVFEDEGCNTLQDCLGEDEAFDSALRTLYEDRGDTLD